MAAPLTNVQKRILSQLANRAYNRDLAILRGRGEIILETADDYRRRHVAAASGKHGLRCCSQDDYGAVKAHFQDLLGETGKAMNTLVHSERNGRRIAEFKLVKACEAARLSLAYAANICRAQFKCSLEDATEKQLWCLMFTVKNRSRKVTFSQEVHA
jgi:hypothetical protein